MEKNKKQKNLKWPIKKWLNVLFRCMILTNNIEMNTYLNHMHCLYVHQQETRTRAMVSIL